MAGEEVVKDRVPYTDLSQYKLALWPRTRSEQTAGRCCSRDTYMPHEWKILIIRQHNQQTGNATVATRSGEE